MELLASAPVSGANDANDVSAVLEPDREDPVTDTA
jgi:hypothetical protein